VHSRYKDLDAFRIAAGLSDDLHRIIRTWPPRDQTRHGDQLQRAADSIGANIAEAAGRWTKAERRRFLWNARGSLYETEYWIDRAEGRSHPLPKSTQHLDQLAHAPQGLIRRHSA
jgi:four helix bundle protein